MITPLQQGMAVFPALNEMQLNGMPASRSYFKNLHIELRDLKRTLVLEMARDYNNGRLFNPNSPKDMPAVYRRNGINLKEKTPTGRTSTSAKALKGMRFQHDLVNRVFQWREVEKQDAFCRQLLECTDDDGPDIQNVAGDLMWTSVETRRLSMRKNSKRGPSLLTIPVRQKPMMLPGLSKKMRAGFIAPEGYLLGAWDLSQIEPRVSAHFAYELAGDDTMLVVIASGKDLHTTTASLMFNVDYDAVEYELHRVPAKTTRLGITYGQGASGLKDEFEKNGVFGYTVEDCQAFIDKFYEAAPGVKISKDMIADQCEENGYVTSLGGMYRYLPVIDLPDMIKPRELKSYSAKRKPDYVRAESRRKAYSHVIQATAQEVMQSGMAHLHQQVLLMRAEGIDVQQRLQIHDEVILTFPEDEVDIVDEVVTDSLTNHCFDFTGPLHVEVECDGNVGKRWSELK